MRLVARAVGATGGVGFEDAADFIANAAEGSEFFFVRAGGVGGIIETPMVPVDLPGKDGTGLIRIAANGDDGFHWPIKKLVQVLGTMGGDIDTDFVHDLDGQRVNITCGFRSGALDIEKIASGVP
jgi:hypothetical protein